MRPSGDGGSHIHKHEDESVAVIEALSESEESFRLQPGKFLLRSAGHATAPQYGDQPARSLLITPLGGSDGSFGRRGFLQRQESSLLPHQRRRTSRDHRPDYRKFAIGGPS